MRDEEVKKGARELTRTISFHELAAKTIPPAKPRVVRGKAEAPEDPYFRVIDAGHDLLMTGKKNRDLVGRLPKDLEAAVLELESIMKEITLSAMEDEFDYHTQMNRYYFHMTRVHSLGTMMSFRMGQLLKNRTEAEKYLGSSTGRSPVPEFLKELKAFAEIGQELALSSDLFMDAMEREPSFEAVWRKRRARARREALARKRELALAMEQEPVLNREQ